MLNILINSYACCPGMGSEPGMGWNWVIHLAKYCNVFVITEEEFREQIEKWLANNREAANNIHFYWNPIGKDKKESERRRRMCWNQGDWRFYIYYKKWQLKTLNIARQICLEKNIDILHQLNMIGFREPGYLWKLSQETGIPFVWGPIGGLKQFPMKYADCSSIKIMAFMYIKNIINRWQINYDYRINAAIKQAKLLVSSIPESYDAIKKYKDRESIIIPETGTFVSNNITMPILNRFYNEILNIVWVGKFDFRKRLDIALRSISIVNRGSKKVKLRIFGGGNEKQNIVAKNIAKEIGIENEIEWLGNRPNHEVVKAMQEADLFLFTSISEDTSTVVLEAIGNGLPVMCFDTCGMANVITDTVGIKIPLSNPKQSEKDFAENITYLYNNRDVLKNMSENCKERAAELSWDKKAERMVELYHKVLKNEGL